MDTATADSIHGHDVIGMIVDSGRSWRRDELERAIAERWGAGARFHTCSAEGMDAAALIAFLAERGKFVESAQGLAMDLSKVCAHDH